MKLLLYIRDNKTAFVMELLKNFHFVKAKLLTPYKAEVLENLSLAVKNMNLVKQGKLKARPAKELLNELLSL